MMRLDLILREGISGNRVRYVDVNLFSPFAKSHLKTNLESLFKKQKEKKKDRVTDQSRTRYIHPGCFVNVRLIRWINKLFRILTG